MLRKKGNRSLFYLRRWKSQRQIYNLNNGKHKEANYTDFPFISTIIIVIIIIVFKHYGKITVCHDDDETEFDRKCSVALVLFVAFSFKKT